MNSDGSRMIHYVTLHPDCSMHYVHRSRNSVKHVTMGKLCLGTNYTIHTCTFIATGYCV